LPIGLAALALMLSVPARVHAEARLLLDATTGKVLFAENATQPWYPASLTKLMTTYTTLRAIKEGHLGFNSLITVTRDAAAQQPTKMGFKVGTRLTVDNALKMMLVKSANDIAVTIADGVGGSIPKFADMMNANARRLGMTESHFVNPNGLPAEHHVTSARDLGILALALIHQFPQDDFYWHIHSIRYGDRIIKNYNRLLARYPGADGMKTGFICASGFNIVASATRHGRRLIAIVLGADSGRSRTLQAAELLQMGFNDGHLAWLMPSLGSVYKLAPIDAQPPDLRDEVCGGHRHTIPLEASTVAKGDNGQTPAFTLASLKATADKFVLGPPVDDTPPVVVFTGPPGHPDPVQGQSPHRRHSAAHRRHKKTIDTARK
jgi:D-alanyl-D-alanine carboxypeptidase